MALRYYPASKIKTNQRANPGEFSLNGLPYTGSYYSTFDGKYFSGENPIFGSNEELIKLGVRNSVNSSFPQSVKEQNRSIDDQNLSLRERSSTQPTSYYPFATETDYSRGYLTRCFVKKVNQNGYVIEISEQEFESIRNGTVPYDISFYQTTSILWKLTGPLRNKRVSQYDTRAGIIDTNKRLVETANKTFIGIKEFIGEDYTKFARPTE